MQQTTIPHLAAVVALSAVSSLVAADPINLPIDATKAQRTFSPQRLAGTNVALWHSPETLASAQIRSQIQNAGIRLIRMPGGSWSDITFWNGNGVRDASGKVDPSKMINGYPAIDYSAYAPAITVDEKDGKSTIRDWHGNVDVKTLHEFVRDLDAQALVCVNGGTGRPIDAAEWVRWAKAQKYNVGYWEVGNELDGGWEDGHIRPDGSVMTAEKYAALYADFAKAMKAADPTIKVGGAASGTDPGGFNEAILRDAGDQVDFVSIHTYPGLASYNDQQQFARASVVSEEVARARQYIQKYQPARKDKIEIGYTEWNLPASRVACDLDAALWSALFLREMATAGVDFATQWDLFTQGPDEEGGHAMILPYANNAPKSEFWAFSMWNAATGPQLLASGKLEGTSVEYLATRDDHNVYLMLVNTSRTDAAQVAPKLAGFPQHAAEVSRLTFAQYFWNPFTRRPEVTSGPAVSQATGPISVPPFSLVFARFPDQPPAATDSLRRSPVPDRLQLIIPKTVYAGEETEVWVRALEGDIPAERDGLSAEITTDHETKLTSPTVRLAESAGRTFLRAAQPGTLTITARSGNLTTTGTIEVKPSVPRPRIIWECEEDPLSKDTGYESDFPLVRDLSARANQPVARIDLKDLTPGGGHDHLVVLKKFPADLDLSSIRGVLADVKLSRDFATADPNASIEVIMQSQANWWMPLGSFKLDPAKLADWQTQTLPVTDEKHTKAMFQAVNVMFILHSTKPVTGSIYLDRMGLMVR